MAAVAMEDVVVGAGPLEDDPVFLQALLTSYLESTQNMSVDQEFLTAEAGETPPASADVIKHLALIELREEDILDPVNRECCVCLDEHCVGDKAVRLSQCGHLYHSSCLVEWLKKKCTCPFCRYEYPTDDAAFEQERLERLEQQQQHGGHSSKPRLTRHEMGRLSRAELTGLLPKHDAKRQEATALSLDNLTEHLIESGAVELVNRPQPLVEHSLSSLRKNSMTQLRKLMKDVGVFCLNPKDCNKKEDLIKVFISSGRLRVVPEPAEGPVDKNCSCSSKLDPLTGKPQQQQQDSKQPKGLRKKIRHFFGTRK